MKNDVEEKKKVSLHEEDVRCRRLQDDEKLESMGGIERNCLVCSHTMAVGGANVLPICPECRETRDEDSVNRGVNDD